MASKKNAKNKYTLGRDANNNPMMVRQTGNNKKAGAKVDAMLASRSPGAKSIPIVSPAKQRALNAYNNFTNDKRRTKSKTAVQMMNGPTAKAPSKVAQGARAALGTGKRSTRGNSTKARGGKGK